MELRGSEGSSRRAPKRRPLGDVTNVVASSSSADASSAKHRSRPGAKAKSHFRAVPGEISTGLETSSVGSVNSGDPEGRKGVPSTSAAQVGGTTAKSVIAHCGNASEVNNLLSTRRQKNKRMAGADVLQSSCPPVERIRSTGDNLKIVHEDVDHHGAFSVPYPKPKKKWRYTMSEAVNKHQVGLPRDFVEKQKAYFAEIDAFELPEEVVSESELE